MTDPGVHDGAIGVFTMAGIRSDFAETLPKPSATMAADRPIVQLSLLAILLIINDVGRWRHMVWPRGLD
jgi:hypothetical protein